MKLPNVQSPCVIITAKGYYPCLLGDGVRQTRCLGDHGVPARLVMEAWFLADNTEPYPYGTILETTACQFDQKPSSAGHLQGSIGS